MESKNSLDSAAIERITEALSHAQESMPPGQNWNLSSDAACHMLAEKVWEDLRELMYDGS